MEMEALARVIAQEVLNRLRETEAERPCVLVLADREARLEAQVRERLGQPSQAQDILFSGEVAASRTPHRHLLPRLSCSDMADLATGRAAGAQQAAVLNLLLNGVSVEVLEFEYKAYVESAPGPLYRLYEAHARTLESFGLKECPRPRSGTIRFWENLVTERDVTQAWKDGARVLEILTTARVTPLAVEAAHTLHITVCKRL
jgi:hypothetical protein